MAPAALDRFTEELLDLVVEERGRGRSFFAVNLDCCCSCSCCCCTCWTGC